jgi:hypothetical protein
MVMVENNNSEHNNEHGERKYLIRGIRPLFWRVQEQHEEWER